nr:MAG TPA: hypothetical protein [Caudoviricetes sp.]
MICNKAIVTSCNQFVNTQIQNSILNFQFQKSKNENQNSNFKFKNGIQFSKTIFIYTYIITIICRYSIIYTAISLVALASSHTLL